MKNDIFWDADFCHHAATLDFLRRLLDCQTYNVLLQLYLYSVFFGDAVYNVCRWWRWVRLTRVAVFVHIDFTTTTASITLSLTPCLPLTVFIHLYSILPWVLSEGLLFSGDFIETLPPLHWGLLFSSNFIQTLPPLGTQWRASILQRFYRDTATLALRASIFQWFYPDIAMHILHLPCHAVTLPHSHNALSLWRSLAVWASRRRVQTQSTIHMHIPWYSFIHWHTGILNLSYIHSNSYILDYFLRSKIILHSLCHSPMHSLDPLYTCTNQVTLLYTVTQTYSICHIYIVTVTFYITSSVPKLFYIHSVTHQGLIYHPWVRVVRFGYVIYLWTVQLHLFTILEWLPTVTHQSFLPVEYRSVRLG